MEYKARLFLETLYSLRYIKPNKTPALWVSGISLVPAPLEGVEVSLLRQDFLLPAHCAWTASGGHALMMSRFISVLVHVHLSSSDRGEEGKR